MDSCFGFNSPHQQSIQHSPINEAPRVIINAVSDPVPVVLNDIHHHKARPLWNTLICFV